MDINLGLSAEATGTADVITATYSPAPTLVDKKILFLTNCAANTTTTPTFNPNGLGAKPIQKNASAILVGDILGNVILQYSLGNDCWELITPKVLSDLISQNIIDAIMNSSAPDGINPFATISDIPVVTTPGLDDVLNQNNKSNTPIESVNGKSVVNFAGSDVSISYTDGANVSSFATNDSLLSASWTNGTKTASLSGDATSTNLEHTDLINLNAPSVKKNGAEIATLSDLRVPLNGMFASANATLADLQTYYGGLNPSAGLVTISANRRVYFPVTGTLEKVIIFFNFTPGTNENVSLYVRLNNTTDTTLSTTLDFSASPIAQTYTLGTPISGTEGADYVEMKMTTPVMATNPTNFTSSFIFIFKAS